MSADEAAREYVQAQPIRNATGDVTYHIDTIRGLLWLAFEAGAEWERSACAAVADQQVISEADADRPDGAYAARAVGRAIRERA